MIDLSGKTALVTGGSRGIGRAVSMRLAQAGASVVILDRSDWSLPEDRSCSGAIRARGGRAESRELDVADSAQVDAVIGAIAAERPIDILVNNAGVLHSGTTTETTDEVWRHQFAVNVDGTFFCTRAVIRTMLAADRGGKIVNVSSISGLRANPGFAAYCASKAAIVNLTRQAGIDYAAQGINVNGVAPGFVETDMTSIYGPDIRAALEGQTPNGRWATPEQIADSVLFLSSPLADHICGEILAVDGGWLVGTPVVVPTAAVS
ncbi:NAD(P)-dependent dehydrogenase (short-subunit alcohol dehydrogenase family) [Microbacterium sp. SORGH_AS 1204]|uniref:SDR family NAD(P)-dependent oxidoreductase n=1 Tax=Microbacterium sp. SORGH_AS_1204 TaxID=3041785 RepID=UPI00278EE05F|nr:SDR family NAD(P)-dependent oxidoreductase [Microbacterium sp. SORGH_AS_1204]MDQ1135322.1 NAD(P)-dependent dehydrogenase (short-subunit alcohol dehydrogenase family) [Microbacterium sp. SORGH_AS_1204]